MQEEQTYFGQQLDKINQAYIKTSFGNIFAHIVGQPGQPLILVVHGSGPRNSGDQYLYFLHQYLVRVSYAEKFFIASIDCPGYGRSKGSKEAVKTFSLQMFKEILQDLGYKNYFAMLGHSQGGAAIFNAVYEDPSLTEFLLMDRPVCGNIKRFNKFPIPTLLLYDIEDDGHPLWQGKLLFKQLKSSQFHTYRNSRDSYWVPDNIWDLTLSFFQKYCSTRKTLMSSNFNRNILAHRSLSTDRRNKSGPKQKSTSLSRPQSHIMKKQVRKELQQISQVDKSDIYSRVCDLEELQFLPTWLNQPKVQQTKQQYEKQKETKKIMIEKLKEVVYFNEEEQPKKQIYTEKFEQKKSHQQQQHKKPVNRPKLTTSNDVEKVLQKIKKVQNKKTEQISPDRCSICHQTYFTPVQTNCKHFFCKKCIGESYLVDTRCPLCRTQIKTRVQNKALHDKIMSEMQGKQKERRQRDLFQFEQMLKSIVYIEIGNISRELPTKKSHFSKMKKKYMWEIYAKQPKNFKFEEVSFNINMGQPSSTPVRLNHAPFVFESRGTFSFSCQITIKPKNKDYANITAIHRIQVTPGVHSKTIAVKRKKI